MTLGGDFRSKITKFKSENLVDFWWQFCSEAYTIKRFDSIIYTTL